MIFYIIYSFGTRCRLDMVYGIQQGQTVGQSQPQRKYSKHSSNSSYCLAGKPVNLVIQS